MNLIQRYLRQGTTSVVDRSDARRIYLLNLFSGVAILTGLSAFIQSLLIHEPAAMSIALGSATVLFIFGPILARKNSNASAVYMMVVANALIFFFANTQGIGAATFVYYFPLFFINGWLMDFRKPVNSAILFGLTLTGVVLVVLVKQPMFGLSIPAELQAASFLFNVICAAAIMCLNTVVIVWLNYRRHKELEERIDEREKASAQLRVALKEKEVLLAEIHHRVKNNLAVVRGLLNMQMNTTTNEIAKATLLESVNRVSTMALIHQKLYTRDHPDSIDFGKYVLELVREIAASYTQHGANIPQVNADVKDITLNLNRAVPCGLILNEFLSNAFKHAFKNGQAGIIDIIISHDSSRKGFVNMVVTDNGKGIPEGFDPKTSESLGMTIVQSLSDQLDGHFTFESSRNGTQMKVNFPLLQVN